ncbi:hypothetical protein D3OALGA1CA_5894 [Olavius algarvensis associated proteobacterium Delta 3]|nr:hypothetical protein D3OALGB2SA_1180 [Olavius algarvensis associated proteobacterium Delta 3]CAB5173302.1 hypothetical protein D3OALGA1CA_5894 [Olavius algarvensis associated proteobacterium Delta 3]
MKKKLLMILAILCIWITPVLSAAGDFDGSKPFLCTVTEATECIIGQGCKSVTAEEINLPRYLWINVGKKTIQDRKTRDAPRKSRIELVKEVDSKLIIQGAEQGYEDVRDGFGWTIAVMQDTGQMVLTASGDFVGDIAFGICTRY